MFPVYRPAYDSTKSKPIPYLWICKENRISLDDTFPRRVYMEMPLAQPQMYHKLSPETKKEHNEATNNDKNVDFKSLVFSASHTVYDKNTIDQV